MSGDTFYAHVDDIAAKESLFGARVAHGYFVCWPLRPGLFVDPAPTGPVLANYGLEGLRFIKAGLHRRHDSGAAYLQAEDCEKGPRRCL